MKQKEVEDVLGGEEEYANADSMEGKLAHPDGMLCSRGLLVGYSSMSRGGLQRGTGVLLPAADSQCRRTDDYIPQGSFESSDGLDER